MKEFKEDSDNEKLRLYLELKGKIKPLEKELEELIKYLKTRKSFSTELYVCSVEKRSRQGIMSLKEVIEQHGMFFVLKYKLIKVSTFEIISVTEKSTIVSEEDAVK